MEIEKRGYNFYQKAYAKFNDPQAKALFKTLMEEEQRHLDTFTEFFEEIEARKEAHTTDYLFDEESSRYLTALFESHVFPTEKQADRIINELATVENIIRLAMGAEKDSILLYDELARCSKIDEAKTVFLKLKAEEQRHVMELGKRFNDMLMQHPIS